MIIEAAGPAAASRAARCATSAVVLGALAFRLHSFLDGGAIIAPDTWAYQTLARNVSQNRSYSLSDRPPFAPSIRRAPGYPVFLCLFLNSGDPERAVAAAQLFLDTLVVIGVFLIARELVSAPAAVLAAALYAFHPEAVWYARTIV